MLSDVNNVVAKQYGTLYQLDEDLSALQRKLGLDWQRLYGNELYQLPHAGVFVLERGHGEGGVRARQAGL